MKLPRLKKKRKEKLVKKKVSMINKQKRGRGVKEMFHYVTEMNLE